MARFWSVKCVFIGLACFAGSHTTVLGAPDPTPEELLNEYESSLKHFENCSFSAVVRSSYSGLPPGQGTPPDGTTNMEETTHVWRRGNKLKYVDALTNQTAGAHLLVEVLLDENALTEVDLDPVEKKFHGPSSAVIAYLDKVPDADRFSATAHEFGLVIHGYIPGNSGVLLPRILRESRLSSRKQREGGKDFWILEASSGWGILEIWLDPSRGFAPYRIEQRKDGNCWDEVGHTISLNPIQMVFPEGKLSQTGALKRMQATEYAQIDGGSVVVKFTLRDETQFPYGHDVVKESVIELSDLNLEPDFDRNDPFVISSAIPNNTRVYVPDHRNIEYEWQDGKIVKRVNAASLADMDRNSFQSAGWQRVMYILLGLVPIVLAGVALWWWMRRVRKRKANP